MANAQMAIDILRSARLDWRVLQRAVPVDLAVRHGAIRHRGQMAEPRRRTDAATRRGAQDIVQASLHGLSNPNELIFELDIAAWARQTI